MIGGSGADVFDGGAGTDIVTYQNEAAGTAILQTSGVTSTAGLIIDPNGSNGTGTASNDTFINVEELVGTNYDDTFLGGEVNYALTYDGGTGNNWIDYSNSSGVTINLNTKINTGYAKSDVLINIDNITGSSDNDVITGSSLVGTGAYSLSSGGFTQATLMGGGGDDTLSSGGGNYWLDGGAGNDRLIGTGSTFAVADYADSSAAVTVTLKGTSTGTAIGTATGTDSLINIENVYGSSLNDVLVGDYKANTLWGASGNDTIIGGGGGDYLDGGAGTDLLSYASVTAGMTIDMSAGTALGGDGTTDTLLNFEQVVGSSLNDTIISSTGLSALDGGSGTDEISYKTAAFASGVTVDLQNGEAYWSGGSQSLTNFENIRGSAGNDTLIGDGNANVIRTGGGSDNIDGGGSTGDWVYFDDLGAAVTADLTGGTAIYSAGTDHIVNVENLYGSSLNDVLTSGSGSGTLVGASGDDVLTAAGTADLLLGDTATDALSGGNDTLIAGGSGGHTLYGGGGNDLLRISSGSTANTLFGGSGNDVLVDGGSGSNTLLGGDGADTLYAGSGSDTLSGGSGGDVLYGSAGSLGSATLLGDDGDDTLTAGAGTDILLGGVGNDTLIGGAGSSTLFGGSGNDSLIGGTGTVVADYADASGPVTVTLNGTSVGTASGLGIGTDSLYNIENVIGGTGNDVISGDGLANSIWGGLGNDTIASGGGADYLDGGAGSNKVDFSSLSAALTIALNGSTASNFSSSTYTGTLLNFSAVTGGSGNDVFSGSSANESFDGGLGTDTIDYSAQTSSISVNLSAGSATGTGIGTDTLTNIEVVLGGSGADVLRGGLASDSLYGGAGNDTLFSGTGNDLLDGGLGQDVVDYRANGGTETIDLLHGTAVGSAIGTDTLANIEVILAGTGADTFIGGVANVTLDGGTGTDVIDYSQESGAVTVNLGGSSGVVLGTTDTLLNIEVVVGSNQDDTLIGGLASDSLYGGAGNDTLIGGTGNDLLDGGAGQDILDYSAQTSGLTVVLRGASAGSAVGLGIGTDSLYNIEVVLGGAGNDTFIGSSANETLDGGAGTDTLDYSFQASAVLVDLLDGSAAGGGVGTDILSNFEIVVGSTQNDTLIANDSGNSLYGGSGNDTLVGGAGNDVLDGGAGTDVLSYQSHTDNLTIVLKGSTIGTATGASIGTDSLYNFEVVLAGSGNDTVIGSSLSETLDGGAGTDTLDYSGLAGPVTVTLAAGLGTATGTGVGTDSLYNFEVVVGSSGADLLTGGQAYDTLIGGLGNDTLVSGSGNDTLDGGAGTDTVSYTGQTSNLIVQLAATATASGAGVGTDVLINDEIIRTGSGADTFLGGAWAGTLDGGAGIDTLDYTATTSALTVTLGATAGTAMSALGTDILYSIEVAVGSTLDDTLIGGMTADSLYGGSGNDTLIGGAGNDTLDGGAGTDLLSYAGQTSGLTVLLNGAGAGTAYGAAIGTDSLYNVEIIRTGSGADTVVAGNNWSGTLDGGAGVDTLDVHTETSNLTFALNGANAGTAMGGTLTTDTLYNFEVILSGSGNDIFSGSSVNETFDGGAGIDIADYTAMTSSLTANLASGTGTAMGAGAGTDTLINVEVVLGGSGNNTLMGGLAADTLIGNVGSDTFLGGAGADTFDGGAGIDTVDYRSQTGAVTVDLHGTASGVGIGTDSLTNIEVAYGGSGADVLVASDAGNSLYGFAGNDTIIGGAGNDLLDGGAGTDILDYHSQTSGITVTLTGTSAGTAVGTGIGTDTLYNFEVLLSGAGNDTIAGNYWSGTIDGGAGQDVMDYSLQTGSLTVNLGAGTSSGLATALGGVTDTLMNIEVVIGSQSSDTLMADGNGDSLFGGLGNDTLIGGVGNDTLDGGSGTDTVTYASQTSNLVVQLDATSGATATGSNIGTDILLNDEIIRTGSGADTFVGGNWSGTLDGGAGIDVVDYSNTTSALTLTLGSVVGTAMSAGVGTDYLYNIEVAVGSSGNDTLIGGLTADTLYGGVGNDTFLGSAGADTFDGGAGIDTVDYRSQTSALTVDLHGTAKGLGIGTDSLTNIEVVLAGSGADILTASDTGSSLYGFAGNDTIIGGSGNDLLDGGAGTDILDYHTQTSGLTVTMTGTSAGTAMGANIGTDTLYNFEVVLGGSGNDTIAGNYWSGTIDGGAGQDVVDYSLQTDNLTISLSTGTATGASGITDSLLNIEVAVGGLSGDTLIGDAKVDSLYGGLGDDTLIAGSGTAWLFGGSGNDRLIGTGSALAVADYADSTSSLTVVLQGTLAGTAYSANVGTDTLINIENVYGSNLSDTLIGDAKANTLWGASGNDTIIGGGGGDYLDGGAGTDLLSYASVTAGMTIDMSAGTALGGDGTTDTLLNFEQVVGSSLNDTIISSTGLSALDGGSGTDEISYKTAAFASGVTVDLQNGEAYWSGGSQSLTNFENIRGSAGNDTLIGDGNANVIRTGGGSDNIDGGGSTGDWVYFDDLGAAVTADLTGGTAIYSAGTDHIVNVENLYGSSLNDVLTSGSGSGTLVGASGDDVLTAAGTADLLLGDTATDALSGGNDTLIAGGSGGHTLYGGGGNDLLRISSGSTANTLFGGSGNDVLVDGGSGSNTLLGGDGADTLYAGSGSDTLSGGSGGDVLYGSAGSLGSATLLGDDGDDTLTAGAGTDILLGGVGNDTLIGGAGSSTLFGGSGNDSLIGGTGTVVADYADASGPVTVTLNGTSVGTASGLGIGTDSLYNIENVIGGTGNDVISGDGLANSIWGGLGNDTIASGGGADYLDGGAGSNKVDFSSLSAALTIALNGSTASNFSSSTYTGTLLNFSAVTGGSGNDVFSGSSANESFDGGLGTDTIDYSAQTSSISVNLSAGSATGTGIGTDTLTNIEVVLGGSGGNTLIGGLASDTLYGGAGNDTLIGGTGNDTLDGGAGTDLVSYATTSSLTVLLNGSGAGTAYGTGVGTDSLYNIEILRTGSGNDTVIGSGNWSGTLDGGAGADVLDYSTLTSGLTVDLSAGQALLNASATDSLYNFEAVIGTSLADTLIGGSAASTLYGGSGNDVFIGSAWNETFDGGAGRDTVDYSATTSNLTVNLAAGTGTAMSAGAGTDLLINVEVVVGGSGSNTLMGGLTADTLIGNAGSDTFLGGTGADTFDGGAGIDTVDYRSQTSALTVDLHGTAIGLGIGTDSLTNIEVAYGGSGGDTLIAGDGGNSLYGFAGNDTLIGGSGNDLLDGGAGTDVLSYHSQTSNLVISLNGAGAGTATGDSIGTDSLYNFEVVLGGTAGTDQLIVNGWSGTIDGGSGLSILDYSVQTSAVTVNLSGGTGFAYGAGFGTDTLFNIDAVIGSTGNDTLIAGNSGNSLYGGSGNDVIQGGAGNDLLDGGSGQNVLDYHTDTAGVTVHLNGSAAGVATGSNIGADTVYNFEVVLGGSGNDTLIGDNLGDTLYGNGGNNSLYGGTGNDTFYGGTGNDVIDGGAGINVLDYSAATSSLTVALNGSLAGTATGAAIGTDTLYNVEVIVGSTAADTLIGDTNADTLYGGSGNDVLIPGLGSATIDGGAGIDTVDFSSQTDNLRITVNGQAIGDGADYLFNVEVIKGGQGNDTIVADNLGDTLYGNSGNDSLVGGSGNDVMDGGAGQDTVDYHGQAGNLTISLATGIATGVGIGTDTLSNFEVVLGGSGNDVITGNASLSTTLYGNGGNNSLYGGAAADTFYGGTGNDVIDGKGGTDVVDYSGQNNNLTIALNGAANGTAMGSNIGTDTLTNVEVIWSGSGNDTIIGSTANESFDGGAGTDTLYYINQTSGMTINLLTGTETGAGLGTDTLTNFEIVVGGSGADVLVADNKGDSLYGGIGNDTLIGGTGNDLLDGGAGTDTLDYHTQTSGLTILLNSTSAGTAMGSGIGTDSLYNFEIVLAGSGNDTIIGSAANETIDGGAGIDTVDYSGQTSSVTVNLAAGTGTAMGASIGTDILINVEVVVGLTGDDTLMGGLAADTLFGGAGNDTLIGGTGNDTMDGGVGIDIADYHTQTSSLFVALNGASAGTAYGAGIGTDSLYNMEVVITGAGNDTLIGNSALSSTLIAGAGSDTVIGGAANDTLDGGAGIDTLDYSAMAGPMTVLLNGTSAGTGVGASIGTDTLYNFEIVLGSAGNDTIVGNSLISNTIYGNGGNNSLYGGQLADTLYGGTGNDLIDGGAGVDMVDYSSSSNPITVSLNGAAAGTATGTSIGTDTLYNVEVIVAGAGNDVLTANPSTATSLYGGAGSDLLTGGSGNDLLDGGAGTDTLNYSGQTGNLYIALNGAAAGTAFGGGIGTDTLYNFEIVLGGSGNDTIVGNSAISNTIYGNGGVNSLYGGNQSDTFYGGTGNDYIDGGAGSDVVDYRGESGAVTVTLNGASSGSAYGSTIGTDTLINVEIVLGGSGNDIFIGSSLNETFDGGTGIDTINYGGQTSPLTINLLAGSANGLGIGTDTLTNIEVVISGSGADTLIGDNKGDSLYAGAGNDTVFGGSGNDLLDGGVGQDILSFANQVSGVTVSLNGSLAGTATGSTTGTDSLYNFEVVLGGSGNDVITGDGLGDTLYGGAGSDSLYGGAGNDTLVGGSGNDLLDGKGGTDTADYSQETAGITASLTGSFANGSSAGTDTLANIEVVIGTGFADTLIGGLSSDSLYGGAGTDTFIGGTSTGTDLYDGGAGTDAVFYSTATSNLVIALNGASAGTAYGASIGTDTLYNIEIAVGGSGNDSLVGDNLGDSLYGGLGNDTLTGGSGNDLLDGGAGTDVLNYSTVNANISATLNGSLIGTATGTAIGTDTLYNVEVYLGGSGADYITILDTNTSQLSSVYGHTIDGGAGIDTVNYSNDANGVTVYLTGYSTSGVLTSSGVSGYAGYGGKDAQGDYYTNVENVIGSNLADTLVGGTLSNTILGGSGNDLISGLGGGDTLDGGAGTDTVDYSFTGSSLTISLTGTAGTSTGTAKTSSYTDTLLNFENIIGGYGNDTIIGDSNDNTIDGNAGSNSLYGGAGNDTFIGGHGSDYVDGGAGSSDALTFLAASSGIIVYANGQSLGTASVGGLTDTFVNIEYIYGSNYVGNTLVGVSGVNHLIGGNVADTLISGTGTDYLVGNGGNDTFIGGHGHAFIDGGSGDTADMVMYSDATAGVTVDLSLGTAHGSGSWADSLSNIEYITGSSYNDVLVGNSSANMINGGLGNDTIYGGGGADTLLGGSGNDSIILSATDLASVASIDGGSGSDYLGVTSAMSLSHGSSVISSITNVENIDLTGGGTSISATAALSYSDISQILGSSSTSSALTLEMNGSSYLLTGSSGSTAALLTTVGSSTVLDGDTITLTSHTSTTYNSTTYTSDYYTYVHSGATVTLDLVHH